MPELLSESYLKDMAENYRYNYHGTCVNPDYSIVTYERVSRLYHLLMCDPRNKDFTLYEQKTLVQNIIYDLATSTSLGDEEDREAYAYRTGQSNKHMEFFDIFIGPGEAVKIEDVLARYGIGTDVLKKIRFGVDDEDSGMTNWNSWYWYISWTRTENNTPVIEAFEIFVNRKRVYSSFEDIIEPEPEPIGGDPIIPIEVDKIIDLERGTVTEKYKNNDTGRRHQVVRDIKTGRFIKWK